MAVYVGGTKCNAILGNVIYNMNLYISDPIANGIFLLSSDDYLLKDSMGLCLIPKDAFMVEGGILLLKDGCVLKDKNNSYLTIKEVE
jgi:hypothetical protein